MSDDQKIDMLYDMLKDVQQTIKDIGKSDSGQDIELALLRDRETRISEEISLIRANLYSIGITLAKNTDLLEEHIAGVNTLKALHLQNVDRIQSLEEPVKFRKILVSKLLKLLGIIATIAGTIAAVFKFIK
jgi:hypothetical protein